MLRLALSIALRFRQNKASTTYLSFISMSSTLGIGLGCCVLILLLSVMNGFERELEQRLLALIPHGELFSVSQHGIDNWQQEINKLQQDERIISVQPYAKMTGMLQQADKMKAVELTALHKDYIHLHSVLSALPDGIANSLGENRNALVLGQGIMQTLGLNSGDKVQLLIPAVTDDLSFQAPKSVWLEVVGSFSIGGEIDHQMGFVNLAMASSELNITSGAQGLRFELHDPFNARYTMREIGYGFEQAVFISDWTRTQGHLYQDIQLVRVIVMIALILVIAVASFNIVSGLVMSVEEKQGAIGILKTMGMNNQLIRLVFVLQGLINGVLGVLFGTVLGVVLALNLSDWISAVERWLGVSLLSGDIYFVDFLPTELMWSDVGFTVITALLLCVIATLYPASKAAQIEPAKALSY